MPFVRVRALLPMPARISAELINIMFIAQVEDWKPKPETEDFSFFITKLVDFADISISVVTW